MTTERYESILAHFMRLARENGLYGVTHADLADVTGIPVGSRNKFIGSMEALRTEAIRRDPELDTLCPAAERDARILAAAMALSIEHGYRNVTRRMIATHTGLRESTINNYGFRTGGTRSTIEQIRAAVMHQAVADGHVGLVLQGLAARDSIALDAPEALRAAAVQGAQ